MGLPPAGACLCGPTAPTGPPFSLLGSHLCPPADVWRRLHPQEAATYSVWNEKTSARAFNRVRLPSALDPAAGPGRLLPGP